MEPENDSTTPPWAEHAPPNAIPYRQRAQLALDASADLEAWLMSLRNLWINTPYDQLAIGNAIGQAISAHARLKNNAVLLLEEPAK